MFPVEKTKQELHRAFILSKLAIQIFKINEMSNPCKLFKLQYKRAEETLNVLLLQKSEINSKLESDFSNVHLHKELRTLNMDIRITENEMEHAQFRIQEYETKQNTLI